MSARRLAQITHFFIQAVKQWQRREQTQRQHKGSSRLSFY